MIGDVLLAEAFTPRLRRASPTCGCGARRCRSSSLVRARFCAAALRTGARRRSPRPGPMRSPKPEVSAMKFLRFLFVVLLILGVNSCARMKTSGEASCAAADPATGCAGLSTLHRRGQHPVRTGQTHTRLALCRVPCVLRRALSVADGLRRWNPTWCEQGRGL